jgi:hypothetical protein
MSGPDVWGPHGWKFLHYITLGYPKHPTNEHKQLYKNFIEHFKYVIPCSICGNHFREHLKIHPITDEILSDRIKFIEWGINMHNEVNIKNQKKIYNLKEGYEQIVKDCGIIDCADISTIEIFGKNNTAKQNNIYIFIIILILLIISLFIIYKYKDYII